MAEVMSSPASAPGAGLRAAAWLAFVLLLVVVFGAAFIRFAQGDAALEGAVDAARWSYRVAAIVFVLVIAGIAVLGWDVLRPGSRAVLGAQVALAVGLTFLGRITPSSDHPLVAFGNPLGGLALVGLAWWIVLAASPGAGRRPRPLAGGFLAAAAFLALATTVVWPVGIAAGLAVQLATAGSLVAGITLLYGRDD